MTLDKRSRRRTVRAAERVSEATRSKSAVKDRAVIQAMLREMDQLLAEMDQNQAKYERSRAEFDRLGARTDANLRAIREQLDCLRRTNEPGEEFSE